MFIRLFVIVGTILLLAACTSSNQTKDTDTVVPDSDLLPDNELLTETEENVDTDDFFSLPKCGDGAVQQSELCDDGPDNGEYGHCGKDCQSRAPYCGDGSVDIDHETCEKDQTEGCNKLSGPYWDGIAACRQDCSGWDTSVCIKKTRSSKQWGTDKDDFALAVTVDQNGNTYVVGMTDGAFEGFEYAENGDAFLTKWNADRTLAWTAQWGTAGNDEAHAVAVDNEGNVFVTGDTGGSLDEGVYAGGEDIFLTKWNIDGVRQWTRQWGTELNDGANALTLGDDGILHLAGYTYGDFDGGTNAGGNCGDEQTPAPCGDILLINVAADDGTLLWSELIGKEGKEHANGLALDGNGNGYIAATTQYVEALKVGPDGTVVWSKEMAYGDDVSGAAVALDESTDSVYLAGYAPPIPPTEPQLPETAYVDIYVGSLSLDGIRGWEWRAEITDHGWEYARSIAVDAAKDQLYVVGGTEELVGTPYPTTIRRGFLAALQGDDGKLLANDALENVEAATSVAVDAQGNIYVTGYTSTNGSFDAQESAGEKDAFLLIISSD